MAFIDAFRRRKQEPQRFLATPSTDEEPLGIIMGSGAGGGRGYEFMPRDPDYPDETPEQTKRRYEMEAIMRGERAPRGAMRPEDFRDPTAAMFPVAATTKMPVQGAGYGVEYNRGPLDLGYVYQPSEIRPRSRSPFVQRLMQKREELPQPIIPRREFRTQPTLEEEAGPYRPGRDISAQNLAKDAYRIGKRLTNKQGLDRVVKDIRNSLKSYEGFGGYDINEPVPTEPLSVPHLPFRPRRVERKEKPGGGRQ